MNVLEVQDALKDFSQEQLIKEMQMPSGQAPQFLVLSELNRRQRMKQDFEARQAQQQPTVAEKLVAAAGAPQGGIGAMAQSMAPQTDMAMNTGINQMQEPMSGEVMAMQSGGLTVGGTSIGSGGGLSDADIEASARKFNMTVPQFKQYLAQQGFPVQSLASTGPTAQPAAYQPSGGGGLMSAQAAPPPATGSQFEDYNFSGPDDDSFLDTAGDFLSDIFVDDDGSLNYGNLAIAGGSLAALPFMGAAGLAGLGARGALAGIRALPRFVAGQGVKPSGSALGRFIQNRFASPRLTTKGKPFKDGSLALDRSKALRTAGIGTALGGGISKFFGGDDNNDELFDQAEDMETKVQAEKARQQALEEALANQETTQDRIMDLLEKRQKSADMDKYLALAQAGFTLMQPTEGGFAEALGKAGIAGVQAYQEAEDRYQTGLADILDTEIALAKLGTTEDERAKNYSEILKNLGDAAMAGLPVGEAQRKYIEFLQNKNNAGALAV